MKKKTKTISMLIAAVIVLISSAAWLVLALSNTTERSIAASIEKTNKPVIVLLFDSLMTEPMQAAIKEGIAPLFLILLSTVRYILK